MLHQSRYDQVLDLAAEMAATNPAEVDYDWIAQALRAVLECPVATFSEVSKDGVHGLGWPRTQLPPTMMTEVTHRNIERHPLIQHYMNTADRRPLAVTDMMALQTWRSSAVGSDIHAVTGFHDHLAIPLRSSPGTMRAFALGREDRGFTAQEREFVERVHPSLVALDDRARALRSQVTGSLTRREEQVLALIAMGLTRQVTARRLRISIRTVDKHLESVYRKLDVSSHVQAIIWWRSQPRSGAGTA